MMKNLFFKLFVNKKNFALLRAALAIVLAAATVILSGFAIVYQIQGPTPLASWSERTDERYVSADVKWIMDVCGEEINSEGKVLYYYAVAPVGNRFVLLRFEAGMLDDLNSLQAATMDYLTGSSMVMDFHLPVRGMVETAEPGAYSLLSEWFNTNIEWMELAGVVGENPSAAGYLAQEVLLVDQIGSVPYLLSWAMSVLAALLVLYALAELVLVLAGFYKSSRVAERARKRQQKKKNREKAEAKAAREAGKAAAKTAGAEASGEPAAEAEAVTVAEEPVAEEPMAEEPVTEETVAEAPAEDAPAEEAAPVTEEPAEAEKEESADA